MSERYPGGLIRKTPPTVTGPTDGEGGSAPGIWTLEEVAYYEKAGLWPKKILPRELYSWGYAAFGATGHNTINNNSSPIQIGTDTWSSISAGNNFSFAVRSDGTLWTWGLRNNGRLGHNDLITKSSPVQVGALTNWSSVATGSSWGGAIKTDGTLWMWGDAYLGVLGNNTSAGDLSSPVQIGSDTDWSAVSCGNGRVTHFLKTDGTLWGTGEGFAGAVGDGTVVNRSSPVQIGTDTDWYIIRNGSDSAIALKTDGTLWGWGSNSQGELGQNDRVKRSSPVQVGALTTWSTVGFGKLFVAAIKTDGTLWTWGDNTQGQLGQNIPTATDRSSPVQVGSETYWSKAETYNNSMMMLTTNKTLFGVGDNGQGMLGNNAAVDLSSPVQIGSDTDWLELGKGTAGALHVLAFKQG